MILINISNDAEMLWRKAVSPHFSLAASKSVLPIHEPAFKSSYGKCQKLLNIEGSLIRSFSEGTKERNYTQGQEPSPGVRIVGTENVDSDLSTLGERVFLLC